MEFIKNFKCDFILSPEYNFIKELKNHKFDVKVKIHNINMECVYFKISEMKDIDLAISIIKEQMIDRVKKDVVTYKKIANKVINKWENEPDSFHIKKLSFNTSKMIYENISLLKDDEYHVTPHISIGKKFIMYDYTFATGCGGDTYYDINYYIKAINEIDNWLNNILTEINSSKNKLKYKNYINSIEIVMSYKNVIKYIKIPDNQIKKEIIKKSFPMNFSGTVMNILMSELDDTTTYIDNAFILHFKKEYNIDLTPIKDFEIEYSTDDYMHNDGQILKYKVVFTSPDGIEYITHDEHCAITGWIFSGDIINIYQNM
jgi:hypothetical protein